VRGDIKEKVIHGGIAKRSQEITGKCILDFSANINPFPPAVVWDASRALLEQYPDDSYARLKEVIAARFSRNVDEITVGNGSIELIRVFCSVLCKEGMGVWREDPTFGEYELSASLAGARVVPHIKDAEIAFLCNPNNPTGLLRTKHEVQEMLGDFSQSGKILFLDEAFIELSNPAESLIDIRNENLFLIRSLTKSFAVPGIRFGYGFGDPGVISRLEVARPPWSVNAYAESFAIAAFRHYRDLERSRTRITEERGWVSVKCSDLDLGVHPSSANFLLLDLKIPARVLCQRLLEHDILIRDCSSFGLPFCVRVAVRSREENRRLIEAMSVCLH
jgi:threonine-phosphate decarboxylase